MKELTGYLRKGRRFPLRPLCCDLASTPDNIFPDIKTQIPNLPLRERVRGDWISDETWSAIDARVTALQEGAQKTFRKLVRRIRTVLSTDCKRRAEEAGLTIDYLLALERSL